MQMRFDGLLGFPGGLVDPSRETLEDGLSRELLEELGVRLPVSIEDHVSSCYGPPLRPISSSSSSSSSSFYSPPPLITHFYVKKIEEEQVKEVERAAASTAADHGLEVLGMVRVPLYTLKRGGGLPLFLSHTFIGNARSQLVSTILRLQMMAREELHKALTLSVQTHRQTAEGLQAALTLTTL
ncbi:U8 snoRNA-decapping enzyme isoform X2 [Takifugu rubripes]|nr:U8 snoRNA-decapping enzyme-like isoform X2 [Takifugu rubripes]|eukprot:XP_011619015.1 PREDICTED: U8 snoRNA-decapping enzyme-like isoform X2 [Takifugu rubripes]